MGILSSSDDGADGGRETKRGASEETVCSHPRGKKIQRPSPYIEVISG